MEEKKKQYSHPEIEFIECFCSDEVIACSGEIPDYSDIGKPGWGWGDKNHDHYGPPGQNKKNR